MGGMVGLFKEQTRGLLSLEPMAKFKRTIRKNGEDVERAVDNGNPAATRSADRTGAPPRKQPRETFLPSCYPSALSCPI